MDFYVDDKLQMLERGLIDLRNDMLVLMSKQAEQAKTIADIIDRVANLEIEVNR